MNLPRTPLWARCLPPYQAPFCFCISELIYKVEVHTEDLIGRQQETAVDNVSCHVTSVMWLEPQPIPKPFPVCCPLTCGSWIQLQSWY